MTTPTRYHLAGCEYDRYMEEDSDGDYVLYDDYAKLKAQNEELLNALKPIELRFISGNSVSVGLASIPAGEWRPVAEAIAKAGDV